MTWVLVACTQAWLLCGMKITADYQTKADCYEAREIMLAESTPNAFRYVICKPKEAAKP